MQSLRADTSFTHCEWFSLFN